ncbi:MAG: Ig domain-containing protein [Bacteroidota bacterium]
MAILLTSRAQRRQQMRNLLHISSKRLEAYDLVISRMENFGNSTQAIPERVTLLRPNPSDPSSEQLFLDQLPIPREAWRYDAQDRILSWQGAFGGGHLHIYSNSLGAVGNIGAAHNPCSVRAGARAQFNCAVALDCGASYETSGGTVVGLLWDATSDKWKSAKWVNDRLRLTYTVTQGNPLEPPTFTFEFEDKQTGAIPWDPGMGAFAAALQLGEHNSQMVWNLSFKSNIEPDSDQGNPYTGPDSVYPYWLSAMEDAAAATINGAFTIDGTAPHGTLVGLQGVRAISLATGYYRTSPKSAPFGIFDGRLIIDGKPVANSGIAGNRLVWEGLDPAHQQRTGLAETGSLQFVKDGSSAHDLPNRVRAYRLNTSTAIQAINENKDLHPMVNKQAISLNEVLSDGTLNMYGLLAMAPFAQKDGQWGDAVQGAVTQDLSNIMNSFISADMWNLVFPGMPQPTLNGELAKVANSAVPGISDPKAWYQSLATSVMTQGLADGSDSNCKNLNGPRAAAWLKQQVSTSKVYYTHGQALFQYEWQQRFPLTFDYLTDQNTNSKAYEGIIDNQIIACVNDINTNVITDAASDPKLKQNLIDEVRAVGAYAKTNKLYWAFAYYTYNTAPAILANIALQMGINTGSTDGTTLSRLFQQNVSVLTAMDPSGYFAQQYNKTINIFLSTNILPSMFGFTGDASSFDLIKLYLQSFVTNNIHNEDAQIAAAASQIQQILAGTDADEILKASIAALRSFSEAINDALALPYVANKFVNWFSTTYPKLSSVASIFSGLFISGIGCMAIFNLISEFKSWDKLTDEEKAQLITDTTQIGLQVLAAIVKRGVRVYAIFNVDGMTSFQRVAAVNRIIVTGEAEALDQGLVKIGNTAARWLADTEGTIGRLAVTDQGIATAVLVNGASTGAEDAGWVAKVLGKNLDEFIATRIGPLFILAGIGYSIYSISQGDSGVALASDILNIVGGALMLFATIGEWAVAGGLIAADGLMAGIIAVAGPLAILAALAGIGLMFYEMFKKQPDPVEEFVNNYAKLAGLYVPSKASSIDYAFPYINKDQANLLMIGFSLSNAGQYLSCNANGSISLGTLTTLPNCIWQVITDGLGMSKILTVVQPDPKQRPIAVLLSLMSDNSVSFQPQMPAPSAKSVQSSNTVTVKTQTWLSTPRNNATVTSDGIDLVSLILLLQPVLPDSNGQYAPSQASGYLQQAGSGVVYSNISGTLFTLTMSGMAPNYMTMVNLNFILNSTPSIQQSYGPSFGVMPSTPMTYAVSGGALPPFLTFDPKTGAFAPNGQQAAVASQTSNTVAASNTLGNAQADFTIAVEAPAVVPTRQRSA